MNNVETIKIRTIPSDGKGSLSFFEADRDIPFGIRRVYYTYGVADGVERGAHAHRALWQLLVCPHGCVEVLLDDGDHRESVLLDRPSLGLIVGPYVWHSMKWHGEDSILHVAASDYYNEDDYIRNYGEFQRAISARVARGLSQQAGHGVKGAGAHE